MNAAASGSAPSVSVEIDDIQSAALHPRPAPYVGRFVFLRVDDRHAGRALLRRLLPAIEGGLPSADPNQDAWVAVAFTYQGLRAVGVPPETLDSFPLEFRQGMAARADVLGDVGESDPAHWEPPFGSPDVHIALSALAPDVARLDKALERARTALQETPGVQVIWQQEVHQLPTGRTTFGFRDGISHPSIEGVGIPGSNPQEAPLKAGEFILGYPDESGQPYPMPMPEVSRNGSYMAYRRLEEHVGKFRDFLAEHGDTPEEQELIAAKLMGRWRSGAPLTLAPEKDDPELGADLERCNDFSYKDNDPHGYAVPLGSHMRRMNPRDTAANINRRRMIRRGATYGSHLPEGEKDDGSERGIAAFVICANLIRQFEFAQNVWVNDKNFHELQNERDPIIGNAHDGTLEYKIPKRPIRKKITGLPAFTTVRGGAYFFLPGIKALNYLAKLGSAAETTAPALEGVKA